jgi:signal transduction histidine kinase
MSVRWRLALTVLFTGLATALGVLVAVALAFERFEREAAYARADAFLGRVVALHADLPAQQRRDPEAFTAFLRSLLLLEPDSQLYLLAPDGRVLASTGSKELGADFKVAIPPVQQAAAAAGAMASSAPARRGAAYVMGDDPELMDQDAVIAARELHQASIRPGADFAGYLYLVSRKPGLPPGRVARLAGHLAGPALGPVLAVVVLATLLAAWIIAAVTRPLAVLSEEVARAARSGFAGLDGQLLAPPQPGLHRAAADDEFGRLHAGFQALLRKLHAQWDQLKRLDAFRRESVSNLSHDLRSPLTAAAASLETLQQRWAAAAPEGGAGVGAAEHATAARAEDLRLVGMALRNTQNAARLVRSLGDLAVLDEASFRLRLARLDLVEVLDDIAMRFAERAARQNVALVFEPVGDEPLAAEVDIELIERAVANLIDNALRYTPPGGRIVLAAQRRRDKGHGPDDTELVRLTVQDSGSGIAAADLERLFDRHFRGGGTRPGDPARAEGSNGLGLAIVQRIVELHGGRVSVDSAPGAGTAVHLDLPLRPMSPGSPAPPLSSLGPLGPPGPATGGLAR